MTHCLHLFLFSYKMPNLFNRFLNLDSEKVRKILNFVRMFKHKRDEFTSSLDDSLLQIGNQVDIESYHKLYYTQAKEALIKAKEEVFLDSEYIDYLTDNILTFEEFCSVFEKSVSLECKQEIASHEFGLECELEALFNALSRGHFYSYGIDLNGETEILDIGHGVNYYKSVEPFVEIIANYGVIIKSSRKEELLAILRDVMGQEFIEFLDKFYANMHLKYLDYKIENAHSHVI